MKGGFIIRLRYNIAFCIDNTILKSKIVIITDLSRKILGCVNSWKLIIFINKGHNLFTDVISGINLNDLML